MRFAEKDGERILPNPLEKDAECPLCKSPVISKCGNIKIWHWAHRSNEDCDNWGGRESVWHLNWKAEFSPEFQEIIVGEHRADIKIKDVVIEFQNASISLEDIKNRELHYGKMKWVLNGAVFAKNLNLRNKNGFKSFRWKWPPKTWLNASCPIYIDMQPLVNEWMVTLSKLCENEKNDMHYSYLPKYISEYSNKLFLIKKVHNSLPCGGWGKLISKDDFIRGANDGYYRN